MRVLHIVPNIDPKQGGPARSVQSLVVALRKVDGLEVKLAAAGPADLVDVPLSIRTRFSFPTPAAKLALRQAIQQADIVELHSLWNGVISYAGKACRELKVPYLYTPRGMLDPYCLKTRGWLKKLSAWMGEERNIAGAAGFHLLSDEEQQGMLTARPYLKDREFVVAPNGLGQVPETIKKGLLKERFPEAADRQTLLFLGRLDEIKGLELPLEAVSLLEPALRPMVLLVGPDFGVEAPLRELVSKLGIAPWVVFAGPIYGDDRFSLLLEADIVGLTSHYECNSVTGTEAFAVGGAVLATEGASLRHAGQAGAALVVPRTPEAYAEGLRTLLGDERRRHQLRQTALLYANRQLDWNRLVQPLVECYRRIVAKRNVSSEIPAKNPHSPATI
jgi:glycosyltransferase involved in cell wall biosynthesis